MLKLIIAADENNLIGYNNKLPWKINEELLFFKSETINKNILMGHNTYVNLPKNLQKRYICVYSTDKTIKANKIINNLHDLDEYVLSFKNKLEDLYITGGKFIYERYYKHVDFIIFSRIKNKYKGDTYINFDLSNFYLIETNEFEKFQVQIYKKKIENLSNNF